MTRRPRTTARTATLGGVVVGGTLGAVGSFFLDPANGHRRRKQTLDRARASMRRTWRRSVRTVRATVSRALGMVEARRHRRGSPRLLDDVTLAHKVETEVFRSADVPKGRINVNAQHGVVQLRGELPSHEMIVDLVERTLAVQGVRDVESLLHLPDQPAPMHQ
jgi:osmotically-inducible protein OsmY